MLPASRAAWRAGLHRDADIGLGQRRRVVGAVAAHGDQAALGLLLADQLELVLGRGLGEEIVDAGFGGDGGGGQRVVAGDHHRADAHAAQVGEALADAGLDDVLQVDDAEQLPVVARPPAACRRCGRCARRSASAAASPAGVATMRSTASTAPLRIDEPLCRSTPDMRVCAVKGRRSRRSRRRRRRRGRAILARASSTIELPSGVSSAQEARSAAVGQLALG